MRARGWALAFWVVLLVATVLLLAPGDALPPAGEGAIPSMDKVEHALTFALLAFLARRAFDVPAWAVFCGLLVYGASIELIQTRVPHRSADVVDWLADVVGASIAFARTRRRPSPTP